MCRGFQQKETEFLKIKAFCTQLSVSCTPSKAILPDFLTLHYLPRINGNYLEINGSIVKPDSPAFLTLHRVLSEECAGFSYWSREIVRVCEGVGFEIYVGDIKMLKGIFRKGEGQKWKMECKCGLSRDDVVEIKEAEVSVAADGEAGVIIEKVGMVSAPRRRRRCCELEDIPEEREVEEKREVFGSDFCWCCDCCAERMDDGDCETEVQMEGVRWALDVGIWIVCLGLGCLVSRVYSSQRLRRKRLDIRQLTTFPKF